MYINKKLTFIVLSLLLLLPVSKVTALTTEEFSRICQGFSGKCTEQPALNAYVGGALDLIATLNEKTDYLNKKVYCGNPNDIFDVPKIIEFMLKHSEQYAKENAMLVFIKYFEYQGGCLDE